FRDVLGHVNQSLGKEADAVFFVIAGIPMKIK
ncbi:bifunctional adenosylcobinamide kinase/adenosylcobinamide-phosphate guanylyltransferase, partial [Enterococcus avium]